ncbi:MAG: phosphatidylserine decarboxylase [Euryarchaeota archaeon]|nr:phosphatidylserine decarboxylase [Euryarchaeota archaeon]
MVSLPSPVMWLPLVLLGGLVAFYAYFHRDPERSPAGEGMVSPADGHVASVEGDRLVIYMGLSDVHVNRAPLAGVVVGVRHQPGVFRPAFLRGEGTSRNERNTIRLRVEPGPGVRPSPPGVPAAQEAPMAGMVSDMATGGSPVRGRGPAGAEIEVVQIAGFLARRIVCHVKEGDRVGRNQRLGMIRLGSRVETTLAPGYAWCVRAGERVRAGETAVATRSGR